MSSPQALLFRLWKARPLVTLKQGTTLSIRSHVRNTNLSIKSKWQDQGTISMLQSLKGNCADNRDQAKLIIRQEEDRPTSLGRKESHLSITVNASASMMGSSPTNDGSIPPDWESSTTKVTDEGSRIFPEDFTEWTKQPLATLSGLPTDAVLDMESTISGNHQSKNGASSTTCLSLEVPEKINLECEMVQGGSIFIHNKLEGDIRLVTTNGDIYIQKLRGHVLDIQVHGTDNTIFASELLEADTLNLQIAKQGRFRTKRIHARTVDLEFGKTNDHGTATQSTSNKTTTSAAIQELLSLDEDDSGALCDISSLYLSGEANIQVQSTDRDCRTVRIKSNHGHVTIDVTAPLPTLRNEMTGELVPIVDLGGVNGSCEVSIRQPSVERHESDEVDNWTSCRIHFDSISPDTVSPIQVEHGNVNITLDRKVESDLRLVSASNVLSLDMEDLLAEGEDEDDDSLNPLLDQTLQQLDETSTTNGKQDIIIRTKAFTSKYDSEDADTNMRASRWKNLKFVEGWVENKSSEPDSRFDRKIRAESGHLRGGGKIRLEGAAAQALQGFDKKRGSESDSPNEFPRPLVAVAAAGGIAIETLSWLGNIARRYGLDDKRDAKDLGRTATRRGRPLEADEQ